MKSVFSDTTLVVTGTVLTLAICLAGEEDAAPRRLAGSVMGAFGQAVFGTGDGGGLKEL